MTENSVVLLNETKELISDDELARGMNWRTDDPRLDALQTLVVAAINFGATLTYERKCDRLRLLVQDVGTNIFPISKDALLSSAMTLQFATDCWDYLATHQLNGEGTEMRENDQESVRNKVENLRMRALQVGNNLYYWPAESEVVYERSRTPKGLYRLSNALDSNWPKRQPIRKAIVYQICPRPFVFQLPEDLQVLEDFVKRDEEIYDTWLEKSDA